MSKYTTELRFICEDLSGLDESVGYDSVAEVIEGARTHIFDFSYPIFDSAYKPSLETKILRHFYTREICAETYGRWKLFLEAKMNEIMPYFNKLYESELIDFQPLYDADYHRDGTSEGTNAGTKSFNTSRTSTNSGTDTTTRSNNDTSTLSGSDLKTTEGTQHNETETHNRDVYSEWNLYSDTPQGGIAGITGAEDPPSLADNGYLTNARHIIHDGDGTESSGETDATNDVDETTTYGRVDTRVGAGTETTQHGKQNVTSGTDGETSSGSNEKEYSEHVYGRMGTRTGAELLMEYRKTFLNIDMDVIRALEPLFFGLW